MIPAITRLQSSRSLQNHSTLQHKQWSSGEFNVLLDFSLQPAVTFSFVIGLVRCVDYCIINLFVNIIVSF
jgi:hypothetical protein